MATPDSDTKAPLARDPRQPRFPVIFEEPTHEQIVRNLTTTDYLEWAVVSGVSFPLGYLVGQQADRARGRHGMIFAGIAGTLFGAVRMYQNSSLRLRGFGRNDEEVARYLSPTKA